MRGTRTWSPGTCDHRSVSLRSARGHTSRNQNTRAFFQFFHFVRVLSSQRRQEPRHRRPSSQVSSSTAKSACAFDTDKLRTNDHVCKNKRSGRTRALARASRRLTTERRSLVINKRENAGSRQNQPRRSDGGRKPNGFCARTCVALKSNVNSFKRTP